MGLSSKWTNKKKKEEKIDIVYPIRLPNPKKDYAYMLDLWEQLKRYFRGWNEEKLELSFIRRPAMKKTIENFEKHLKEIVGK